MSEQQRIILALALSFGILFAWQTFFAPPVPVQDQVAAIADVKPADALNPVDPIPADPTPSVQQVLSREMKRIPLENGVMRTEIADGFPSLRMVELRDFSEETGKDPVQRSPVSLVSQGKNGPEQAVVHVSINGTEQAYVAETRPLGDHQIVLRAASGDGVWSSDIRVGLRGNDYAVTYDVVTTNRGAVPLALRVDVDLALGLSQKKRSFFAPPVDASAALCRMGDEFVREDAEGLEEVIEKSGSKGWAGIDRQYFVIAAIGAKEGQKSCTVKREGPIVAVRYGVASGTIAPGESSSEHFVVYLGPKRSGDLERVDSSLVEAIDYTIMGLPLAFLAKPMLWALSLFHAWTGSWGLAIVLLTFAVKALLFPITYKSVVSMRRMQLLKPKIEALRERFKDDRMKQQEEQMKLFRETGVDPLGGCLPMLLQMPVWFALYRTLWSAVDLYQQPFLWLKDLTAAEPFPIMALLLGIVTFVQQKMTPTGVDSQQAKIMLYVMPIMLTFFMIYLPSGLVLYILANSILTIIQQLVINRREVRI